MQRSFGLYIHWPFCAVKCPYCDFNSHVRKNIPIEDYHKAYQMSLERLYRDYADFTIDSIFFGGGTPSTMPPSLVAKIIEKACLYFSPSSREFEITLEANPTSSDKSAFKAFRDAGVNRLSLGIQSLDDKRLRFLGRNHDAATARKAIDCAEKLFDNISLDAIYACPGQSCIEWEKELTSFLAYDIHHLALYQLSIEKGTPFSVFSQQGRFNMPDADTQADFYEATSAVIAGSPLNRYEISNYAVPGYESVHNKIYWHYGYYAGIGPGAHGRLPGKKNIACATVQKKNPDQWLHHILDGKDGMAEKIPITPLDAWNEALMMGLRLEEGISFEKLNYFQEDATRKLRLTPHYQSFVAHNYLKNDSSRLQLTMKGFLYLDYIARSFIFA